MVAVIRRWLIKPWHLLISEVAPRRLSIAVLAMAIHRRDLCADMALAAMPLVPPIWKLVATD